MAEVTVSVIICTRNRAEHLQQTLSSIATIRTPRGLAAEVLVVDNDSNDRTVAVCRQAKLPHLSVRYVREPRPGQCHARNTGMKQARGRILLFTDDDVRPPENWIAGIATPIASEKTHAVSGGVRIAPHLERDWMDPLHRGWLASTEGIDPAAPYTMFGANMAFSREVLQRVPAFDTELGPGALGFGDEMLFSWQLLEAGYRLIATPEVAVEHHFEEIRLLRTSFLDSARKRGDTQAYLDYHWRHRDIASPRQKYARTVLRLVYWRVKRRHDCKRREGCAQWEMELTQRARYFRRWIQERRRPRQYELRGLVKLSGVARS